MCPCAPRDATDSVAHVLAALPRPRVSTRHPLGPTCTIRSPERSVRRTRLPDDSSSETVEGTGWPKRLPVPTLISATSGLMTSSARGETASALPWWPTLSTSRSPTVPASTSGSMTSASASPVTSASNPFDLTNRTSDAAFSEGSGTGLAGETTSTRTDPTEKLAPAASSLTGASSSAAVSDSSSAAPDATMTRFTATVRTSASVPPVWSSCACVNASASSRRTPLRSSASRSAVGSGPVSTSRACGPSRTRIASPWPTSSTTSETPAGAGGPKATTTESAVTRTAKPRAARFRGRGHTAHTPTTATISAPVAAADSEPSGTDA